MSDRGVWRRSWRHYAMRGAAVTVTLGRRESLTVAVLGSIQSAGAGGRPGQDGGLQRFSQRAQGSEERRVGKSVDLGGRRIIKKKKKKKIKKKKKVTKNKTINMMNNIKIIEK